MFSPLKLTPNMPTETMIDAINQNFRQQESEARRKVITDENGTDRIVIGRRENGTYGIDVSQPGVDVNTAEPDQLVMSSEWDMWKIISSGTIFTDGTNVARSGTISLSSSNIAYVNDICIKIDDIYGRTADTITSGYAGHLQAFLRDASTKQELSVSRVFYWNGTNLAMKQDCYFVTAGGWITLRRIIRWRAGTFNITPRNYMNLNAYWSIANPSRIYVGGMGGGGTPTGQNVYWDVTIYNGSSEVITDNLNDNTGATKIQPGAFSALNSSTYVLPSLDDGYLFGELTLPIPARFL